MIERYDQVCADVRNIVRDICKREGDGEAYEILDQFLGYVRERVEADITDSVLSKELSYN